MAPAVPPSAAMLDCPSLLIFDSRLLRTALPSIPNGDYHTSCSNYRFKAIAMKNDSSEYSRGGLSSETGVNIETIRYYEKIGLMPDPARSPGGHRVYDHQDVKRLFFIRRSRELGFTLREVGELLHLVDGGRYTCDQIRGKAVIHLDEVAEKIRDLQKMQQTLSDLVLKCKGDRAPECPIVDTLFAIR